MNETSGTRPRILPADNRLLRIELWPQCGASAARRDSGCAEQWESRSPLLIAPCHAGRRRSTVVHVLRVLPGPSVVKQRFALRRHAGADNFVLPLHLVPPMVGCRTPHLAHGAGGACRTAPIR